MQFYQYENALILLARSMASLFVASLGIQLINATKNTSILLVMCQGKDNLVVAVILIKLREYYISKNTIIHMLILKEFQKRP